MRRAEVSREEFRADWIIKRAPFYSQRTGQYLFNELPHPVAEVVRTTNFDPFYKELSKEEIMKWYDDHVIFDDNDEIILLFSGNNILWEKE